MLLSLMLALAPQNLALAPQDAFVTVDNPRSIYDLGATPVSSQPLQGPTASFWSRASRIVQLDLPLAYNPTGIAERFSLGLPDYRIYNGDAVVLFHGQQWHYQVPLQLIQTLNAAGYLVIVPNGGSHTHYGSQLSSDLTEGVLAWVGDRWPLDQLFAYGFSHGGGSGASFVARHPGWFSGLLQHTGTVDLEESWRLDPGQNATAGALEAVYGGPPTQQPFDHEYERMSTKGSPMGANLAWAPTVHYTGSSGDDSWNWQLWPESVMWGNQLIFPRFGNYSVMGHLWANVPYADVVTWLATASTGTPANQGDLVMDQDGPWGPLTITQGSSGTFSSLNLAHITNRADITAIDNVDVVEFDVDELGWSTAPGTQLLVHANIVPTATQIVVKLHGLLAAPTVTGPGTSAWVGGVLVLTQGYTQWQPWTIVL